MAQHALHAEPSNSEARLSLANLKMVKGEHEHVLPIIGGSTASNIEVDTLELTLRAVARVKTDSATALKEAQRAVVLAPWERQRWLALAYVKSNVAQ